jgi:antitoxin CcdA
MRTVYAYDAVERSFAMNALPPRKATNLSLDAALVDDARALDVNLSRAAEEGLRKAVAAEKGRRWLEENRAAIDAWNGWVEKNGLPLAQYRQF